MNDEKYVLSAIFIVPVIGWLVLGWYFSYLPLEDYKLFCKGLWAIPTAITFVLFILIKITILILSALDINVANVINGRHYLKSNEELIVIANMQKIIISFIVRGLVWIKYITLVGVGWGTLGAVIWFILIQFKE